MQMRAYIQGVAATFAPSMLTPLCSLTDWAKLQLRFNLQLVNPGASKLGPQRLWMYLRLGKNDWRTLDAVETDFGSQVPVRVSAGTATSLGA